MCDFFLECTYLLINASEWVDVARRWFGPFALWSSKSISNIFSSLFVDWPLSHSCSRDSFAPDDRAIMYVYLYLLLYNWFAILYTHLKRYTIHCIWFFWSARCLFISELRSTGTEIFNIHNAKKISSQKSLKSSEPLPDYVRDDVVTLRSRSVWGYPGSNVC